MLFFLFWSLTMFFSGYYLRDKFLFMLKFDRYSIFVLLLFAVLSISVLPLYVR